MPYPFDSEITAFGLAYHGVHWNERYDENDFTVEPGIEYEGPSYKYNDKIIGGRARLMIHPNAPGDQRDELAKAKSAGENRTYRDYLLLSGRTAVAGGAELGAGHWLYCDESGTVWNLSYEGIPNPSVNNEFTIKIYNHGRFGYFSKGVVDPEIATEIGSFTFSVRWGLNSTQYDTGSVDVHFNNSIEFDAEDMPQGIGCYLETSPDGRKVIINFRSRNTTYLNKSTNSTIGFYGGDYVEYQTRLVRVILFEIDGDGDLEYATFGDGITATGTSIAKYSYGHYLDSWYEGPEFAEIGSETWHYWDGSFGGPDLGIYDYGLYYLGNYFFDQYGEMHYWSIRERNKFTVHGVGDTERWWSCEVMLDDVSVYEYTGHIRGDDGDVYNTDPFVRLDFFGEVCTLNVIDRHHANAVYRAYPDQIDPITSCIIIKPDGTSELITQELRDGYGVTYNYPMYYRITYEPITGEVEWVDDFPLDNLNALINPTNSPCYV